MHDRRMDKEKDEGDRQEDKERKSDRLKSQGYELCHCSSDEVPGGDKESNQVNRNP